MNQTPVNWNNIRPFKGSQNKGFEQLCFQLARGVRKEDGLFTEVDDSGGGDGVEFYQTQKDGKEWGWQAKYYEGSPRLKESNRKAKIVNSLRVALGKHPKMSRWILCTNTQFTPEEKKWFNTQLKQHIPKGRKVILEHWSEGILREKLDLPLFSGVKNAFFGTLQLSNEWFRSKFDGVYHLVEEKFEVDLHTKDNSLYLGYLDPLLVDENFKDLCVGIITEIENEYDGYCKHVGIVLDQSFDGLDPSYKKDISTLFFSARDEFRAMISKISNLPEFISANSIADAMALVKQLVLSNIPNIRREVEHLAMEFGKSEMKSEDAALSNKIKAIKSKIWDCTYKMDKVVRGVGDLIRTIKKPEIHHLHLLGNAGIGKTHISVAIAREFLNSGLPVIFIPAAKFSSHSTLQTQILQILDIASAYSFDNFIEVLNSLGHAYDIRVPIVIDGLNESVDERGILNPVWKRDLRSLQDRLKSVSNVCLVTTCRTSYAEAIWTKSEVENIAHYKGIIYDSDRKRMVAKYFEKYRLTADLTYLSFSHFSHPLFLKIFCENKAVPGQDRYIQIGSESIYDTFREFIGKCDGSVNDRLRSYGHAPVVGIRRLASGSAHKMGKLLWQKNARHIPIEGYLNIFDESSETYFPTSKAKAVMDEGLLLLRDWGENGDHVGFTYDLVSGYSIACFLIDEYKDDLLELIKSNDFFDRLLGDEYDKRHPLYEDILDCFIALVPMKTGIHIYSMVPRKSIYKRLYDLSFSMLFKLSATYITDADVEKANKFFQNGNSDDRELLMRYGSEISFVPSHPLNFQFFSRLLPTIELIEKDLSFGEYLWRCDTEYLEGIFNAFRKANRKASVLSAEQQTANELVAEFSIWTLGSNIKTFRSAASEGLYYYGRNNPQGFLILLVKFLQIEDLYLRERLVAVAYGLVSAFTKASMNRSFVFDAAIFIYDAFFRKGAKYSTTHVLIRDYASLLINAAIRAMPEISEKVDVSLTRAPYKIGGIRRWRVSQDKDKKRYKEGNSPIDFFFTKDELPRITKENEYKAGKRTARITGNILWRIYQLGYRFERFEKVDQRIAQFQGADRRDSSPYERFGQKYVWIAYYELAGFLEDEKLIPPPYKSSWPIRNFGERFDPTFPDDLQEMQYFEKNLLGTRGISVRSWLKRNNVPEISELLEASTLTKDGATFVLLDGYKCQSDNEMQRQLFFWLTAFMVNKKNLVSGKRAIAAENVPSDIQAQYQETIYNGEYPYSDYFPAFGPREIEWKYKRVRSTDSYSKETLFYKNRELSRARQEAFWSEMEDKYSYTEPRNYDYQMQSINNRGEHISMPVFRFVGDETPENLNQCVEGELSAKKYVLTTLTERRPGWKYLIKKVKVFLPVINTRLGDCVAREIVEKFDLQSRAGSVDLYDREGNRVSISFRFGDKYNNNYNFTYIRKDILDQYLKDTNQAMFWSFDGEWNHWVPNSFAPRHDKESWKKFSKIIDYKSKRMRR